MFFKRREEDKEKNRPSGNPFGSTQGESVQIHEDALSAMDALQKEIDAQTREQVQQQLYEIRNIFKSCGCM